MTLPLGGNDSGFLDQPLNPAPLAPAQSGGGEGLLQRLGWSPTTAPVAFLLMTGIALGPNGINLLSPPALALVETIVPVALAALGLLVGLALGDRRTDTVSLIAVANLDTAVTVVLVSAGLGAMAYWLSMGGFSWALAVAGGICSATSLTLPAGNHLEPRTIATRIRELNVLLPIVSGGLLMAWLHAASPLDATVLAAQALVTVAVSLAGWLLLTRRASETEEGVLVSSALLLVGGVAGALSLSALFGGLIAGTFWRYAGGHPREAIGRDVLFVQHPLLVLVLLLAGARADLSGASLALGVAYLALRVVGKLAGSATVGRMAALASIPDFARSSLSPGVFGVAFALNIFDVVGSDATVLLTAVVIGTIGSEFCALVLGPRLAT